MKPTQTNLADHIGMSQQGLCKMKKDHPKKFALIWDGWIIFCENQRKLTQKS